MLRVNISLKAEEKLTIANQFQFVCLLKTLKKTGICKKEKFGKALKLNLSLL